ncbi:hypothetical protein BpHYR1_030889 [Brachionus plicatilis]|uniref:Uncharacterized protein n=1 Tax=Brachionus plicatilis TaxID=10195 RepID=A0A3M7RG75_BRAPC|nr:hypothetical protein BpHYR1_030889 [Brachionus plicatilis]
MLQIRAVSDALISRSWHPRKFGQSIKYDLQSSKSIAYQSSYLNISKKNKYFFPRPIAVFVISFKLFNISKNMRSIREKI